MYAPREPRLHVPRADETHECALRVGVRDDHVAFDSVTVLQLDTGHSPVHQDDAFNGRAGANNRPRIRCFFGQFIADTAHAAFGLCHATVIASETTEVRQHRVRRTGTQVCAKYGIEADGASQRRALEALGYLVVDVHADKAQEFAHVLPAQPAHVEAQLRQWQQVLQALRPKPRRRPVEVRAEQVGVAVHALAEPGKTRRIRVTGTRDVTPLDPQVVAVVNQCDRRHVS